jgi:hypothetical protein
MGGARRRHLSGWGLTPLGWILAVALVVLVPLAIIDQSKDAIGGLIAVIVIWGVVLGINFPSARGRGMNRGDVGRMDIGAEEAARYRRGRGMR